jgi:hypothetical protein
MENPYLQYITEMTAEAVRETGHTQPTSPTMSKAYLYFAKSNLFLLGHTIMEFFISLIKI